MIAVRGEALADTISQNLFQKASAVTGEELMGQLEYYIKAWLPARGIIKEALDARFDVDPSGSIVKFDKVRGEVRDVILSLPNVSSTHT